jgi:hypothetical protein
MLMLTDLAGLTRSMDFTEPSRTELHGLSLLIQGAIGSRESSG